MEATIQSFHLHLPPTNSFASPRYEMSTCTHEEGKGQGESNPTTFTNLNNMEKLLRLKTQPV